MWKSEKTLNFRGNFRVCLLSHGHPSSNPRLVRDADALADSGYEVHVVSPRFMTRWVQHDEELVRNAKWDYRFIDCLETPAARRRWRWFRLRHKICYRLSKHFAADALVARAVNYSNPELAELAAGRAAGLYIAHQHHSLPAAAWAARISGGQFAFDAEDLLADSTAEPVRLMRNLEMRYLHGCSYISTMSYAAAMRLQETNDLPELPLVLHNTPRLQERLSLLPPEKRPSAAMASIYWFGQTIGPHACIHQLLTALPHVQTPVRICVRGHGIPSYVSSLKSLAEQLGLSKYLEILPVAPPEDMVRLAGEHDILWGAQPGKELFTQMAIGNKVFTGMMAGLALALSDTVAHRQLLTDAPGSGFLFQNDKPESLAQTLNQLLTQQGMLLSMKQCSWRLAREVYNWEAESGPLLRRIESLSFRRR
jgi:glycosyltransferase involved in cell wall biosynthesis